MRRPIGVKFCMVVSTRPNFITQVQNFGGPSKRNFSSQKHAKFGLILDDFKVRWHISPEGMKIIKIGQVDFASRFLLRWVKKVQWTLVQSLGLSGEIVPT